jgi:hypothetical protein
MYDEDEPAVATATDAKDGRRVEVLAVLWGDGGAARRVRRTGDDGHVREYVVSAKRLVDWEPVEDKGAEKAG